MVEALDAGDVTKLGVGIIIALIVLGVIISMLITKLVVRVVVAVAVVALAFYVWNQRTSVENKINHHRCNFTFLGVHLDPPSRLNRVCS